MMSRAPIARSCRPESALTLTGAPWMDTARRVAVTLISSSVTLSPFSFDATAAEIDHAHKAIGTLQSWRRIARATQSPPSAGSRKRQSRRLLDTPLLAQQPYDPLESRLPVQGQKLRVMQVFREPPIA